MPNRLALRTLALGYLAILLVVPVGFVFYRTFEHGLGAAWHAVTTPAAIHAFWLTIELVAIAVPVNTIFGIVMALALVRGRWRGRAVVSALIDLPLALSPVVIGLALILVWGTKGWFGQWLLDNGLQVIFSFPGLLLATIFVSLPFVVRETVPVLREIGTEQEEAAETLGAGAFQTFRRVTFPAIRWAVAYGVVLTTARAIGEFGAVSAVSGNIEGKTQTLPLYVKAQFDGFDTAGAYASSVVLAMLAIAVVVTMRALHPKEETPMEEAT